MSGWPGARADLPDLLLWLALAWSGHIHHQRARRFWDMEAVGGLAKAAAILRAFLRQAGVAILSGPACSWEVFERLVSFEADFERFPGLRWLHLEG